MAYFGGQGLDMSDAASTKGVFLFTVWGLSGLGLGFGVASWGSWLDVFVVGAFVFSPQRFTCDI